MLYPHTAYLMTLDLCRPEHPHVIQALQVAMLLVADIWEAALCHHPDWAYAEWLVRGFREGFRIGFQRGTDLRSAKRNMPSTRLHPDVITRYITEEVGKGRMIGPLLPSSEPLLHVSRFGLIPKGHGTGKFRLITDLSFPHGASVNEGIDTDLVSLSYMSVDRVAEVVETLGKGSLLAKMDIEAAYRLVPVHPHDRVLLAVKWDDNIYVDACLPFGLRSAPKIFNAVADALCWCLQQAGIRFVYHYLDDYILVAPPNSKECSEAVATVEETCAKLGVPMAPGKKEGPTTALTFLGIFVDTVAGELKLPEDKQLRLQELLRAWGEKRVCRRRELESLIGLLNHACKVVRPGCSFLRRLIDTLHQTGDRPQGDSLAN